MSITSFPIIVLASVLTPEIFSYKFAHMSGFFEYDGRSITLGLYEGLFGKAS